jgi:hypothetical protein
MRAARLALFISGRRSPMAPAYYRGRPAHVWIDALERRHHPLNRHCGPPGSSTHTGKRAVTAPTASPGRGRRGRSLRGHGEAGSRLVGNCG